MLPLPGSCGPTRQYHRTTLHSPALTGTPHPPLHSYMEHLKKEREEEAKIMKDVSANINICLSWIPHLPVRAGR